jgi:uncharacterized protein YegP (UPF0339 family)
LSLRVGDPGCVRLKTGTSEIIATSEGYTSKASAKNGIEPVKNNAPDAEVVELS